MRRKFCSRRRRGRQGRARAGRGGARQAGGCRGAAGPAAGPGRGRVRAAVREGGRPCRGDNVGLAVGRALPGAGHGPRASCGRRRWRPGRASPSPRALARGPRACRPPRAHPDLRPPAPPSFLFAKLHRDPRPLGWRTPRPGARGPDGPSFCLGAARPPPAVGRRRQEGVRASGRRGESGTRRVRSAAAGREEAVTPDGSVWPQLDLEGKATSLGTWGEKSVYKTKPWVCLRREFTPGRFVFRKRGKKVEDLRSIICTIFATGHRLG